MHPANQRPGKPDKLFQGAHKQTSYPRVQWGHTPGKREATDPRETINLINQWRACREAETEGNIRSRNNQEYRTTHAAGS